LNSWKALGLNVAELGQLLEIDVQKFRHQAIHALKGQVDQVVAARERELAEEKKAVAKAEIEKADREKAVWHGAAMREWRESLLTRSDHARICVERCNLGVRRRGR
jgi:DNA-binding transcriptional MerR regulator